MKKLFFDVETTGTRHTRHSIHQLALIIEIDDEEVERVEFKIRPHPKALIEPEALKVGGVTEEEVMAYPPMEIVFPQLLHVLGKYVDPYESKDRFYLVGYNNASFDNDFLRALFELCGNPYFMSWFWSDPQDVMVLASVYLEDRRKSMPSFKLKRVAKELGLEVDEDKLHDGVYDVELTRDIYHIVTGRRAAPNDPLL